MKNEEEFSLPDGDETLEYDTKGFDTEEAFGGDKSAAKNFKTESGLDETTLKLMKKGKGNKKKAIVWSSLGGVLVLALAAGSFFMFNNNKIDVKNNEKETRPVTQKVKENADGAPFWTEEVGSKTPIEEQAWVKDQVNAVAPMAGDLLSDVIAAAAGSDLFAASGVLPSEYDGFTSDDNKEYLEDGTLNPMYSYWTREVLTGEADRAIQLLLNPSFGNWANYQYAQSDVNANFKLENNPGLNQIFTKNFKEAISASPAEKMPIYADWQKNNYGETSLLNSGPRWYGEITSSTSDFIYDEETFSYTVEFSGDVKYTAFTSDGGKIERKGTLHLTFVPNQNNELNESGKVLIDNANLTVGG